MKKTAFLLLSGMAIFLSDCTSSSYELFNVAGTENAVVNPGTPGQLKSSDNRGVNLSISPRSSLNIDVECILDYVQGESAVDPIIERHTFLDPWIRWQIEY